MHQTILHVANFSDRPKGAGFASLQYKLTNGLIRAGHNVVTFSDREAARASTPLLSRKVGRRGANRRLLALVESLRPDLVLFGQADTIHPQTLLAIRDRLPQVRLAQWNVDPLFEADNVERIRNKIDMVDWTFVTTAGPLLEQLGKGGHKVAFMPNAVDSSIENGQAFEDARLPWDVFYAVGSSTFGRRHCGQDTDPEAILRDLRARLPQCRFLTPGIGSPHLIGAQCTAALRDAAIGLSISRRNDVRWYASDRMAHMAGNGLLVMIERAGGFDDLFAEDEMAFYDSQDELADLLDRFIRDQTLRQSVARRGWQAYHRMFDCTRVAKYMLAVMQERVEANAFDWRETASRDVAQRVCA